MKVLVSTAFWGKGYCDLFLKYNIPSLLNKNIEFLKCSKLTFLILLPEKFIVDLETILINKNISKKIEFKILTYETFNLNHYNIPHKYDVKKYRFLNACQNFFFQYSIDQKFDYHILNYPDFVWSKESLTELVNHNFYKKKYNAFTGFCLPVDKSFLKELKNNKFSYYLSVGNFNQIALKHLHKEVLIREWNKKNISAFPSFLFWKINQEGILLRTFHKHLIAYNVRKFKENFNKGITSGTLDSEFIFNVQKKLKTKTFFKPNNFNFVSIHDTRASSMPIFYKKKEVLFKNFINSFCSKEQIRSFEDCFYFQGTKKINAKKWKIVREKSIEQVKKFLKMSENKLKINKKNYQNDFLLFQKKLNFKYIHVLKNRISFYNFLFKILLKNLCLKIFEKLRD